MASRKLEKKRAARRLGVSVGDLAWIDGQLIVLATNMTVDGAPRASKPAPPPKLERIESESASWRHSYRRRFSLSYD